MLNLIIILLFLLSIFFFILYLLFITKKHVLKIFIAIEIITLTLNTIILCLLTPLNSIFLIGYYSILIGLLIIDSTIILTIIIKYINNNNNIYNIL